MPRYLARSLACLALIFVLIGGLPLGIVSAGANFHTPALQGPQPTTVPVPTATPIPNDSASSAPLNPKAPQSNGTAGVVRTATNSFVVQATTNIFLAGRDALMPVIPLGTGSDRVITFPDISPSNPGVSCCGTAEPHDADGGTNAMTYINGANGISGIRHEQKNLFLVGVFLDDTVPQVGQAPAALWFTSAIVSGAITDDFSDLSPALRQTFFIGDGKTQTGGGAIQTFHVPAGATRLFLGFADALNLGDPRFGTPSPADPCCYGDNTGFLTVMYSAANVVSIPDQATSDKPQSKLWYNDGLWWSIQYSVTGAAYHIYRLDRAANQWVDTGTVVDTRRDTRADALWNGTYLFVASGGGTQSFGLDLDAVFFRYSYSSATKTYTQNIGPVTIRTGGAETIVLDQDSSRRIWITYTQNNQVYVRRSDVDGASWTEAAVQLSNAGIPLSSTSVHVDDISSLVAFNQKIGVMWSNQMTGGMYFAYHADTSSTTQGWTLETVYQGTCYPDDHINMKVDENGQIFVAVKTSLADDHSKGDGTACDGVGTPRQGGSPQLYLLVRKTNGTWTKTPIGTVDNDSTGTLTRAIVALDQTNHTVYVFMAKPESGGSIYMKKTRMDDPSFPPGDGQVVIAQNVLGINNPTSTKQMVTDVSDLVVLASEYPQGTYRHTVLDIGTAQEGSTRIKDITFENGNLTNATTGVDQVHPGNSSAIISLVTTGALQGQYSVRVQNPPSNVNIAPAYLQEDFTPAADVYVSFYFKLNGLPTRDVRIAFLSNSGTSMASLVLRPSGLLQLRNGATSTTIGYSQVALTVGQVYHVGLHQRAGDGNGIIEAFMADSFDMLVTPFARSETETILTSADRLRFGATNSFDIDVIMDTIRIKTARGFDF